MQAERINEITRMDEQQMDDCQELISKITVDSILREKESGSADARATGKERLSSCRRD